MRQFWGEAGMDGKSGETVNREAVNRELTVLSTYGGYFGLKRDRFTGKIPMQIG